jgi:hypothetical protein
MCQIFKVKSGLRVLRARSNACCVLARRLTASLVVCALQGASDTPLTTKESRACLATPVVHCRPTISHRTVNSPFSQSAFHTRLLSLHTTLLAHPPTLAIHPLVLADNRRHQRQDDGVQLRKNKRTEGVR